MDCFERCAAQGFPAKFRLRKTALQVRRCGDCLPPLKVELGFTTARPTGFGGWFALALTAERLEELPEACRSRFFGWGVALGAGRLAGVGQRRSFGLGRTAVGDCGSPAAGPAPCGRREGFRGGTGRLAGVSAPAVVAQEVAAKGCIRRVSGRHERSRRAGLVLGDGA